MLLMGCYIQVRSNAITQVLVRPEVPPRNSRMNPRLARLSDASLGTSNPCLWYARCTVYLLLSHLRDSKGCHWQCRFEA